MPHSGATSPSVANEQLTTKQHVKIASGSRGEGKFSLYAYCVGLLDLLVGLLRASQHLECRAAHLATLGGWR